MRLPAIVFAEEEIKAFDAKEYKEKTGFRKVEVNSDGSITITMTKPKYDEMRQEAIKGTGRVLDETVGTEEEPYIIAVAADNGFSSIIADVDRDGYGSGGESIILEIGISAMTYQAIAGDKLDCEIMIRDALTKETIISRKYSAD